MVECPRKRVFLPDRGGCRLTDNISKELVAEYLSKYKPLTVEGLQEKLAEDGIRTDEKSLLAVVLELQKNHKIRLSVPSPETFVSYLTSLDTAWWVYAIVTISILDMLLVSFESENLFLLPVRIIFGLSVLGFLPGYSTVKALFPDDPYPPLERILLSIFLSVVVSISLGVILGIRYVFTGESSVLLIGSYTVALTVVAAYRICSFSSKTPSTANGSR